MAHHSRRAVLPDRIPHDLTSDSHFYRLADYLEQVGRTSRRTKSVPAALWDSLVRYANRDDLIRLASEARGRGLLRYAVKIFIEAGEEGDHRAYAWAAGILKEAGRLGAEYPFIAYCAAGAIVAVAAAFYSLRFQRRSLGGASLAGWSVTIFLSFLQYLSAGWSSFGSEGFGHGQVALNVCAGILIVMSGVLAITCATLPSGSVKIAE